MSQQPSDYELMVRAFLEEHPEHIPGARWIDGKLVLENDTALVLMEWCLAKGLYRDRETLKAGIAAFRAKLDAKKPPSA